jgi:hypothetical protein
MQSNSRKSQDGSISKDFNYYSNQAMSNGQQFLKGSEKMLNSKLMSYSERPSPINHSMVDNRDTSISSL